MHRYPSPAGGAPGARPEFSYSCVAVVDLLVGKFEMVRGWTTRPLPSSDRSPRSFPGARHLYWKVRPYGSSEAPRCRETVLEAPEPSHGDWSRSITGDLMTKAW
jgi:hypothetical protein